MRWPDPPRLLSVSSLAQLESCPRRWSLEHADYEDRGLGRGFPRRPSAAVLGGRAAHCALERIARAAGDAGAARATALVDVLRSLGGITAVIAGCVRDELARESANPRAAPRLEALDAGLRQRTDDLRLLVQQALRLQAQAPEPETQGSELGAAPHDRGALGYGYHPEVELRPPSMDWVGYADAIRLGPDVCEIVDYKTGAPSDEHEAQLRAYALLWARDPVVNPSGRLADSLVLAYPNGAHSVRAPGPAELGEIAADLEIRGLRALGGLDRDPPEARVEAVGCRFCDVKALCSDYWLPAGQRQLAIEVPPEHRSLQGVIERDLSPSAASLAVQADPYLAPGTRAVLSHGGRLSGRAGEQLRLLDVRVAAEPDLDMPVVTFGPQSEAFLVP
ncbi:MAG: PD-(D/E)XK nuclease family protein [Chloroflexota bacterium]